MEALIIYRLSLFLLILFSLWTFLVMAWYGSLVAIAKVKKNSVIKGSFNEIAIWTGVFVLIIAFLAIPVFMGTLRVALENTGN